jgi:hypothetical protein
MGGRIGADKIYPTATELVRTGKRPLFSARWEQDSGTSMIALRFDFDGPALLQHTCTERLNFHCI